MAAFKNIVLLSCKYRILAKTPLNSIRFKHDENFSVKSLLNSQLIGSDVCVQGWVKSIRRQKSNTFLHISDGTPEQIQVVIPSPLCEEDCSFNSAVKIYGKLVKNPKPNEPQEILGNKIKVVGKQDLDQYPFGPRKYYPPEYIRQHVHLRPKTNIFSAILRLSSLVSTKLHTSLVKDDFFSVSTPILTSNDCEGAGEVFIVRPHSEELCHRMGKNDKLEESYFNKKVYLTVSSQLHLEAIAGGISKVFTIGPTFRAENSRTRKHLAEFRMLEVELAFCHDLQPLLSIMENLIKQCARAILEDGSKDLAIVGSYYGENLEESLNEVLKSSFTTLTYKEAMGLLIKHQDSFKNKPVDGGDIRSEHELFLVGHTGSPTFVIDWPVNIKPFYMRRKHDDPSLVSCVDLLVPQVGELCGGSLRENCYAQLKSRLETLGLVDSLSWYLDLRKFGGSPTGGFGMGIERLISYLLKIPNVKDITPFPRTPRHCPM